MEPEKPQFKKRLIRNIECTNPLMYMLSRDAKIQLGYPVNCLEEPNRTKQLPMVAIDCEMVETELGQELVLIVLVDENEKVLLREFVRPVGFIKNPRTQITGLKVMDFEGVHITLSDILPQIQKIIYGSILIGHDMTNDMQVLKLPHQQFIDTVGLFPHREKLPFKTKLKDLSITILKQPIQYNIHNPIQDASAALRLAKWHIERGRGTVEYVPGIAKTPSGLEDICIEAELNPDKVLVLILRGSRAGGFQDEQSDYDYVMAYDTWSQINGGLITLYNVDIAFYNTKSFNALLQDRDISILEIFFSGPKYQLKNILKLPEFDLLKLRQSTTLHVYKSLNKSRRHLKAEKNRKSLKSIHMAYRFYDFYDQVAQHGTIVEHRRMTPLWREMKEVFLAGKQPFLQIHSNYMNRIDKFGQQFRKKHPTVRRNLRVGDQEFNAKHCNKRKEKLNKSYELQNLPQGQLNLLAYLRDNDYQYIEDDYRVRVQQHCKYPDLLQFHYLQSANFDQAIPNECRGVIVEADNDNYRIVAFPYYKFFDYNDIHCLLQNFCWNKSQIYDKLDGSTATLYYYDGQWHVASSNKPDGAGQYCFAQQSTITSFNTEFWRVFYQNKYQLPSKQDNDKTFIFELLSTRHLIVVNHRSDRLILHGCRQIPSLREQPLDKYEQKYGWQVIQSLNIPYKSIEDVVRLAEDLDPRVHQGFILKDCNNMRVKIKSSKYLLLSWINPMNNNIITDRSLMEVVSNGQHQIFIKYCPEWRVAIERILEPLEKIKKHVFTKLKKINTMDHRQFALVVNREQKVLHSLFYAAKKGDLIQGNFYTTVGLKKLMLLLENPLHDFVIKSSEEKFQ